MPAAASAHGDGTLIVGASQAGVQAAATLREHGYTSPIVLVGDEPYAPYQRPPLSKGYLAGTASRSTLELRAESYYASAGITVVTGERIVEVRLHDAEAGSGAAVGEGGTPHAFDRLILATGARPHRLPVPGADLDGVCYLRGIDDADTLTRRLQRASHVTVVGGGFIGLEVASLARTAGLSVEVVEAAERVLPRAVASLTSDFYRGAHERRGTRVHLGAAVDRIEGTNGRATAVRLTDGRRLPTDLVVVGIGAQPATELADQLGLAVQGGIVVDGASRTSIATVLAAGDCTAMSHPAGEVGLVRLESVQNAVAQGRQAALAILGRPDPVPAVPWFWSDQYDLKLQIAGLQQGHDRVVLRGDPDTERFSVLYFRRDRLIALDAVNSPIDYMTGRKALAGGLTLDPALAHDPDVPLARLLVPVADTTLAPLA
jgi:3-phenylpropionate/trans-cinnamate dioxygenase ferredoxin reductase subunit